MNCYVTSSLKTFLKNLCLHIEFIGFKFLTIEKDVIKILRGFHFVNNALV